MLNAKGAVYALPQGVAGTEAVGGATHVDATDVGREEGSFWCRVQAGHVVSVLDPNWVRPKIADPNWVCPQIADPDFVAVEGEDAPLIDDPDAVAPLVDDMDADQPTVDAFRASRLLKVETIHVRNKAAFLAWCQQERGRAVDSEGHTEWIERDVLLFALNQWLADAAAE